VPYVDANSFAGTPNLSFLKLLKHAPLFVSIRFFRETNHHRSAIKSIHYPPLFTMK
jgi:hypothetical protein